MIQVNELRISNLVDYNGMYLSVSEIYTPKPRKPVRFDGVECVELHCGGFITATMDDIKPIPLTEEILLKCGFAKSSDGEHFFIGHYGFCLVHDGQDYCMKPVIIDPMVIAYCRYLHQLQNLYFALTGKELEVNL